METEYVVLKTQTANVKIVDRYIGLRLQCSRLKQHTFLHEVAVLSVTDTRKSWAIFKYDSIQ